jgi:hypothetical protein
MRPLCASSERRRSDIGCVPSTICTRCSRPAASGCRWAVRMSRSPPPKEPSRLGALGRQSGRRVVAIARRAGGTRCGHRFAPGPNRRRRRGCRERSMRSAIVLACSRVEDHPRPARSTVLRSFVAHLTTRRMLRRTGDGLPPRARGLGCAGLPAPGVARILGRALARASRARQRHSHDGIRQKSAPIRTPSARRTRSPAPAGPPARAARQSILAGACRRRTPRGRTYPRALGNEQSGGGADAPPPNATVRDPKAGRRDTSQAFLQRTATGGGEASFRTTLSFWVNVRRSGPRRAKSIRLEKTKDTAHR